MRTLFSLDIIRKNRRALIEIKATPGQTSPKARPHHKKALFAGGALACLLTPFLLVQLVLYRANLAVARESFPKAPTLRASDRLLIFAPHCDDETIGAGGTIAEARRRGIPVRLVFFTNGDGSRSTQIAVDAQRRRRTTFVQLAKLRQQETLKAAKALGVAEKDVVFLGYPDGGTKELWLRHWQRDNLYRSSYTGASHSPYPNARTPKAAYCGEQALADVQGVLRDFRATVVITTHPADTHPDHQAAYEFTRAALEQLSQNPETSWAAHTRLLTFLVHHGVWPAPYGYNPQASLVPPAALLKTGTLWMQEDLDSVSRKAKKSALECYPSQLAFTPRYLRSFLRRNELFGDLPPQTAPSPERAREKAEPRSIVIDAARDSLWRDLMPAADLQSIALLPSKDPAKSHITLRLQAMNAPSSRLRYRLWLHNIGAQESTVSRVEIRLHNGKWKASLRTERETQELPVRPIARGFEIDLLREELNGTLLLSAESYLRNSRLDATGTGALRLPVS
jgi:LmbE family N-acetylglucosaminyl deacetylase